jgi:hypothetical protein
MKMKFKNEPADEKMLRRLMHEGAWLKQSCGRIRREEALVLIGEVIFNKFVAEFSSLWRELFPNCQLKDFEASEKEKQHILGERDADEDRNSMPTEEDEVGIEYWDLITPKPKRKPVKAGHQLISDLWRNSSVLYQPGKTKTSNYKQQNKQQLLPGYAKHYQLPKRLKSYSYGSIKLPSLHKSFGELAKNTRNLSPFAKMPLLYQRQIGSKSFESGAGSYKSLESYLTDYKEVVKNEI